MANKKLKRIMTDLAAGHITKEEADKLIKGEKVAPEEPVQEIEGDVPQSPANVSKTQTRKLKLNNTGG